MLKNAMKAATSSYSRNKSKSPSQQMAGGIIILIFWRKRVGIEPTRDSHKPPLIRFEACARHQTNLTSVIYLKNCNVHYNLTITKNLSGHAKS